MKEVILHIGLHKTGSSSIQLALSGYNANGIKTAEFDNINHSIAMFTIFSENRNNYHIWSYKGFNKSFIEQKKEEFLRVLISQVSDDNHQTLIISGEDMSMLTAEEKGNMVKFFEDRGVNVKVIAYVRNPLDWASSLYQQCIRDGHPLEGKISTNYRHSLEPFLHYLERENVLVFSYDEVVKSFSSVTKHFESLFSLKLPNVERQNESFTPFQLSMVRCLNEIGIEIKGNAPRFETRKKIIEAIMNFKELGANYEKLDKAYFTPLLHDMIKKDLEWLNEKFSINFDLEFGVEVNSDIENYFGEVLKYNADNIAQIFDNMKIEYEPLINLKDNFTRAFINFETGNSDFSAETYLKLNPDVKNAGVNPYEHYLNYGIMEGRKIKSV